MGRLKGNYKIKGSPEESSPKPEKQSSTEEFEKRALGKLAGSIAFVQKKDTFVWNGDKHNSNKKK